MFRSLIRGFSTVTNPPKFKCVTRLMPATFPKALSKSGHQIHFAKARTQHDAYIAALKRNPFVSEVLILSSDDAYPDCIFVEDTAVIFGNKAILGSCVESSRRGEVEAMRTCLEDHAFDVIEPPIGAHLDGGDVLMIGPHAFVGQSKRTNQKAFELIKTVAEEYSIQAHAVPVEAGLHLKSIVTYGGPDVGLFAGRSDAAAAAVNIITKTIANGPHAAHLSTQVHHPPDEAAANVLRIGHTLYYMKHFPQSEKFFQDLWGKLQPKNANLRLEGLDVSEICKADGALTCCSIPIALA